MNLLNILSMVWQLQCKTQMDWNDTKIPGSYFGVPGFSVEQETS